MVEQVEEYMKAHGMAVRQDKIMVGISGGADSVCLLFVLRKLQEKFGYSLEAIHVNHCLRGEEAALDQQYVESLCKKWGIPCQVYSRQVAEEAKKWRLTLEEAGRKARRECFQEALRQRKGTKIALGHHREDNVETFLLNLCRGTGLSGLCGIAPMRGVYIRPFLAVSRKQILEELKRQGIVYREDSSNQELCYTRNRVRKQVLPLLTAQINEQSIAHMQETIQELRKAQDYLERQARKWQEKIVEKRSQKEWRINEKILKEMPISLRGICLKQILIDFAGKAKDLERRHVRLAEDILQGQVGRKISLPYAMTLQKDYENAVLYRGDRERSEEEWNAEAVLKAGAWCSEVFSAGQIQKPMGKDYTKWFDYDIIGENTVLRTRRAGDYLVIDKSGRKQKLKKWFINEKVPHHLRDQILLLAEGSHVYWVVGYRQGSDGLVTEKTKRIVEWKIGEIYGRAGENITFGREGARQDSGNGSTD